MKPSLLDEVEMDVLQEGLVGATMIGSKKDSLSRSQVEPMSYVTKPPSYLGQGERSELFQAWCEPCQASHGLPLASNE